MDNQENNIKASATTPRHIAIIMDGNGRWAQSRQMNRSAGHSEGVNSVHTITEASVKLGIQYLTLYAFSTENWNRPKAEVDALMQLIVTAISKETPYLLANNVRLEIIGNLSRLPENALESLNECRNKTAHCTGLTLILALSYSSHWELTEAARQIAKEVESGRLKPEDITEETVRRHLATAPFPDPDLLIRTGGEMRLSNFLLWQLAYAEIFVTPVYWPEFTADNLMEAIEAFRKRERRFGLTGEQVNKSN